MPEPIDEQAAETAPATTPDATGTPHASDHGSMLRGSLVAVLLMTAFFVATWFAIFVIALERR